MSVGKLNREPPKPGYTRWSVGIIAWLLGTFGATAVLLTLADPGTTVDEPLDVRPGRTYLATLKAKGWGFFDSSVIDAVYRDNAEHPPLGRWLLGLASTLGQPFEILLRGGPDPVGIYVLAGRTAPAIAFGAMIGLVVISSARWSGRGAGLISGLSLLMMPRVFAHAHFAALDTFITLFWTLALIGFVWAVGSPHRILAAIMAGVLWGLALLTKIHAWFLPPMALIWALNQLSFRRAVSVFLIWLGSGLLLFFVGWPWLWADPLGRLGAYLGTGVVRIPIRALYFGTVYADRDVPWHYPWFYFVATVPVGLLALGAWGAIRGWLNPRSRAMTALLAGSILSFLVLFSTNVPVYDGERLFLVVFPALAILIGLGFARVWESSQRYGRGLLVAFFLIQAQGVIRFHPFGLSYYNAIVGGLPGAERLGLELTYWGDAVDGVLLDRLAGEAQANQSASLVPTLAPEQGKVATTRRLARIPLVIGDGDMASSADWLLVSRRSAYWPESIPDRLAQDSWVMVRSRQGVWLSALLLRSRPKSP